MKITLENYKEFAREEDQELLLALLADIKDINDLSKEEDKIYIDIQTEHTEYSPERTDPCPDYYGMYSLRFESDKYETIGDYMDVNELDNAIFILYGYVSFVNKNG